MSTFAQDLIRGLVQVRDRGSLSNSALKLLLVALCLGSSIIQFTLFNFSSESALSVSQQCMLSLTLIIVTSVDLRSYGRSRFFLRSILFSGILVGIVVAIDGDILFLEVVWDWLLGVWSSVPVLRKVEGTTWLGIIDLYAAFLAVDNMSSRDYLWFGRRIVLPAARPLYQVLVVTVAVLFSAAPRVGSEVYWIARMRSRLLMNPRCESNESRIQLFLATFTSALLSRLTSVAQVVERLLEDRGFFSATYSDPGSKAMSSSDVVAIVLLIFGSVVITIVGILRNQVPPFR